MRTLRTLILAAVAETLLGCGQKGPLVLPDAQHPHRKIGIGKPASAEPAASPAASAQPTSSARPPPAAPPAAPPADLSPPAPVPAQVPPPPSSSPKP